MELKKLLCAIHRQGESLHSKNEESKNGNGKRYIHQNILAIDTSNKPFLLAITFVDRERFIALKNALSIEMMENLIHHLTSDQQNKELRVIVISGEGPAFSAGHNLKELASDQNKQQKCFQLASELMNKILDCPVPVIAKVDGIAAAAGCQLVAQCDMAVASKRSVFSTPGANFGIFCSTPGVALARSIPKTSALYMLFTGSPVSAEEAFRIGLITKMCAEEKLNEEVENICKAIKAKSRDILEFGKTFYYQQIHYNVKKAYELGGKKMQENLQIADCKEGIQSFIEKRKPHWGTK